MWRRAALQGTGRAAERRRQTFVTFCGTGGAALFGAPVSAAWVVPAFVWGYVRNSASRRRRVSAGSLRSLRSWRRNASTVGSRSSAASVAGSLPR